MIAVVATDWSSVAGGLELAAVLMGAALSVFVIANRRAMNDRSAAQGETNDAQSERISALEGLRKTDQEECAREIAKLRGEVEEAKGLARAAQSVVVHELAMAVAAGNREAFAQIHGEVVEVHARMNNIHDELAAIRRSMGTRSLDAERASGG